MEKTYKTLAVLAIWASTLMAGHAQAGSIENLERERTILVDNMLSPEMTPAERQTKMVIAKRRLIDLERIALRDKSLVGRNTAAISRAFANYDLTFIIHASVEKGLSLADHWMEQVGITQQDVLSAVSRRR
tara:strand:- start:22 stop:414 length:393 start_codon:yes stop_codon:yes gene_type:complete